MDDQLINFIKELEDCFLHVTFCPIGILSCEGPLVEKGGLREHLTKYHPKRIIKNPASLKTYITQSSLRTSFIFSFDEIFVLLTNVCLTTNKLTYQVKYEGDKYKVHEFKYTLKVRKKSFVLPITSQFHDELSVKVDLDDIKNIKFLSYTLTIHSMSGCNKCKKKMTNKLICKNCEPTKRLCGNSPKGCIYKDTDLKCNKHEQNFCKYKTVCPRCLEAEVILLEHYVSKHHDVISSVGSFWRAKENINKNGVILKDKNGDVTVICQYRLFESTFEIQVSSDLVSTSLVNYGCYVTIINPKNGENRSYTVIKSRGKACDWELKLGKKDFLNWNTEFDVSVDVCEPEYKKYLDTFV